MVHPIVVSPRPFMFTKEKPVMNMYDYCLPWGIVFSSAPASVHPSFAGAFPVLLFPNLNPVTDRQMFV